MKTSKQWTAGNALSWALGATLGLILGVVMLIMIPRLMFPPVAADSPEAPQSLAKVDENQGAATSSDTAGDLGAPSGEEQTAVESGQTATEEETASQEPATAESETSAEQPMGETGEAATGTPVAAAAGNAESGKAVYTQCAGCHGSEGQGGIGPKLDAAAGWSEGDFTVAVREGKTPEKTLTAVMPRFAEAQLSAEQVNDVHAYLKTLY